MSEKIESDKILIADIFKKWFCIPEYQRPYVWDDEQVIELLDDISYASNYNDKGEYFLGSFVYRKEDRQEEGVSYTECQLINGQQRITTIFLILAVIRDLNQNTELSFSKELEEFIYQRKSSIKQIPERMRMKFLIRDQVNEFIKTYIKELGSTTHVSKHLLKDYQNVTISHMINNIITIRQYFSSNNSIDIKKFVTYLLNKTLMIYISSSSLEDSFKLFTVLNDRGIKLRNSDIIKAINLTELNDTTLRQKWSQKWEDMESYFEDDFDRFLEHIRAILVKEKARTNLLNEFEKYIYLGGLVKKGEETSHVN